MFKKPASGLKWWLIRYEFIAVLKLGRDILIVITVWSWYPVIAVFVFHGICLHEASEFISFHEMDRFPKVSFVIDIVDVVFELSS